MWSIAVLHFGAARIVPDVGEELVKAAGASYAVTFKAELEPELLADMAGAVVLDEMMLPCASVTVVVVEPFAFAETAVM